MENHDFLLPDLNFQVIPDCGDGNTKPGEVKNEEIMFFSPLDQMSNNASNNGYQIIQEIDVNLNSQPGPSYAFLNDEGAMKILPENFDDKLPVDLTNLYTIDGIKSETTQQHYMKYREVDGKSVKFWECGICGKEFGHQYTLMRHLPTHTDERKFQCNTCGKAFRQMSTLSQHRAIHSSDRPYICEICQKTFNRVSTLISHRKTHTGLKPHRCHLCNKAFHQKGNLRNHIFTHTNERPYKCDICDKGFNQMSNLMCHKLKAHQRADKPKYVCRVCGRDFPKRMALRNHEQYQHGITQEPKEEPNSTVTTPKYDSAIIVDPIKTEAMQLAIESNQTPFALLRPLTGIPVLVRVLPAGDKQMLVPASADDLKKYGQISITNAENQKEQEKEPATTKDDKPNGTTVQIKIPVVATVIQQSERGGLVSTSVVSPGPNNKSTGLQDNYVFTTNLEEVNNTVNMSEVSFDPNTITPEMMHDVEMEFLNQQNNEFNTIDLDSNISSSETNQNLENEELNTEDMPFIIL